MFCSSMNTKINSIIGIKWSTGSRSKIFIRKIFLKNSRNMSLNTVLPEIYFKRQSAYFKYDKFDLESVPQKRRFFLGSKKLNDIFQI